MEITGIPELAPRYSALRAAAESVESAFLSEMLKNAGLGSMKGSFGGGAGEDQFSSMLRQEQARLMTNAGGIGLAEHLVRAMARAT